MEEFLATASPVWEIATPDACTLLGLGDAVDDGPLAVIARIDAYLGAQGHGSVLPIEDLGGDGGARWSVAIRIPRRANAIILFAEDPQGFMESSPQLASLSSARSVVGVSTPLESPFVDDLVCLVRILDAAANGMLALVDPALDSVRLREDVRALFLDGEPLADERALFRTQIVARDESTVRWLFTEGMPRVGRPDFEMLEVCVAEERAALTLLEVTASLFLSSRLLPPPETPIALGDGVEIALVTPREALVGVDPMMVGGDRDRSGERAHFHPRKSAVVCAPSKRGAYRQVWTRPVDAIAALQAGTATLALPEGIRRSTACRARRSWPEVVQRKREDTGGEPVLAQVNVGIEGVAEHAWIEVTAAHGGGGAGKLLHNLRDARLRQGASVAFTLEQVSDWSAHA